MDKNSAVVAHMIYDPWGNPLVETYVDGNFSGIDNLNNYSSYSWDETLGLYYAQNRFYDAGEHRFTQEDPAKSGGNWYSYCDGNPLTRTDVWGLKAAGEIVPYNGSKLDIILVQWQLDKLGYKGANGKPLYNSDYMMDGIWGPNTEFAVKAFQREHGLTVDGLVGDATWKALGLSLSTPTLTMTPSTTSQLPQMSQATPTQERNLASPTPNVNAPKNNNSVEDYNNKLQCKWMDYDQIWQLFYMLEPYCKNVNTAQYVFDTIKDYCRANNINCAEASYYYSFSDNQRRLISTTIGVIVGIASVGLASYLGLAAGAAAGWGSDIIIKPSGGYKVDVIVTEALVKIGTVTDYYRLSVQKINWDGDADNIYVPYSPARTNIDIYSESLFA